MRWSIAVSLLCLFLQILLPAGPLHVRKAQAATLSQTQKPKGNSKQKGKAKQPPKKGQKGTKGKAKAGGKAATSGSAKPSKAPAARAVTKTIEGISVVFPGQPTFNDGDPMSSYTLRTGSSILTVYVIKELMPAANFRLFLPEWKGKMAWEQETIAYSGLQEVVNQRLGVKDGWNLKDNKTRMGKRYAVRYATTGAKARQGVVVSFIDENYVIAVQGMAIGSAASGQQERANFVNSVKLATKK